MASYAEAGFGGVVRRMSKRWEPIRLRRVGECHNMRQGVMGNASIFARE